MENKIKIEFDLNQSKLTEYSAPDELFQNVVDKYAGKVGLSPGSFYILVNGKINPEKTVGSLMTESNKLSNSLSVVVNTLDEPNKEIKLIKSKNIICPKCYEPCKIKLEDDKFTLYDCPRNHKEEKVKIVDFPGTQMINMCNIKCINPECNNWGNSYKNQFFKCLTCKTNLCLLCKQKHDESHTLTKYEQKDYICPKHNSMFIKYCRQCKLNLCIMCDEEHEETHDILEYKKMAPKKSEINTQLSTLKKEVDIFQKEVLISIEKLNELIRLTDAYYQLKTEILNSYDIRNTNYNILENIKEINNNNDLFERLKVINRKEISQKVNKLITDLYDAITDSKKEIIFDSKFSNLKEQNIDNFNFINSKNKNNSYYNTNQMLPFFHPFHQQNLQNFSNQMNNFMNPLQEINQNQMFFSQQMMNQNQQGEYMKNNFGFNYNPNIQPIPYQNMPNYNISTYLKLEFEMEGKITIIDIPRYKIFGDAIDEFRYKNEEIGMLCFEFNGKILDAKLSLDEIGLKDGDRIIIKKTKNLTLYFDDKDSRISIEVPDYIKLEEAVERYKRKLNFKYNKNGKPLLLNLTIKENGFEDGDIINVKKITSDIKIINLFFEQRSGVIVNIQIGNDKKVSDAINSYRNKMQLSDAKFIFNSKILNPDESIINAGLKDLSHILVEEEKCLG